MPGELDAIVAEVDREVATLSAAAVGAPFPEAAAVREFA
jgi:hypothetical protein